MLNPLKYFRKRNVGLALGSGGAKGLAHIAVMEYLESLGIPIHLIAGSSIGAVIGALHCMGKLGAFKEDILKLSLRDLLTLIDPVMPRSGLIHGKGFIRFMERYIPRNALIEDLAIPLAVIATDYVNGTPVVFRTGSILEALRASVSIPGVLVPVRYRDTLLVDGGVANPLPINTVRGMGADITIAVNLHPQIKKRGLRHYVKSTMSSPAVQADTRDIEINGEGQISRKPYPAGGATWLKAVEQWFRPDMGNSGMVMPNIFEVIAQSVDIMEYVNTMLILKYNAPTVLIEPSVIDVETLNFTDADRIIAEGHRACSLVRKSLIRRVRSWV
ncbi:MAG: hypothetical protein A2176_03155 [Spirochaetes bacterium RBG_13_51_14]|nr:MAG: hypothetical protein A2176_03155 [Spirochaetes bacterium RBG_13_51_14]